VRLIAYMCPSSLDIGISSSFFCTSGKETVENLKLSHGQLAPCQENRIKGQQTVSSAGCKVLASNGTDLVRLIAYMCPSSLEIGVSSSFFLHFWLGDSRKSQDLAWAACSVPRKSD